MLHFEKGILWLNMFEKKMRESSSWVFSVHINPEVKKGI